MFTITLAIRTKHNMRIFGIIIIIIRRRRRRREICKEPTLRLKALGIPPLSILFLEEYVYVSCRVGTVYFPQAPVTTKGYQSVRGPTPIIL